MYELVTTESFENSLKRLVKNNSYLKKRINKAFKLLKSTPFYPSLKTHKINTSQYGEVLSSRVTGDIRILWLFDADKIFIIILLDIGGHSGSKRVYK